MQFYSVENFIYTISAAVLDTTTDVTDGWQEIILIG